jgi:hypothetical protein
MLHEKIWCCPMHHGTKMCKFKKKLIKMVNIYELLLSIREEEEIPYPNPPSTTSQTYYVS